MRNIRYRVKAMSTSVKEHDTEPSAFDRKARNICRSRASMRLLNAYIHLLAKLSDCMDNSGCHTARIEVGT